MNKQVVPGESTPLLTSKRRVGSGSSSTSSRYASGLTVLPLIALIFYEVSGGPFGIEESVMDAGGPFLPLILFIVLPLVWSLPEALITAELSTAFPEDSGSVAWVESAFGEGLGFCSGVWSWLSGVCDNAIYPVLFAQYLVSALPGLEHGLAKNAFTVSIAFLWTMFNWLGLNVVGTAATLLMIGSLAPFGIMSVLAIPKLQPQRWLIGSSREALSKVKWNKLLNIVFWNVNYWDSISTLSGEVEDISMLPRAMFGALLATILGYLIPLLAASGICIARQWDPATAQYVHGVVPHAPLDSPICQRFCEPERARLHELPLLSPDHSRHVTPAEGGFAIEELGGACNSDGYFQYVASALGGRWLYVWLAIAALCSNFGQFQAEMASDSFMLLGMAERGMLPLAFARRSRFRTPTLGILFSMAGVLLIVLLRFDTIIALVNLFYIFYMLIEFAAFVRLRQIRPDLPRSFKVPLGTVGCALMVLPACVMMVVIVVTSGVYELCGTLAFMAVTALLYPVMLFVRGRGWMEFNVPAKGDPLRFRDATLRTSEAKGEGDL